MNKTNYFIECLELMGWTVKYLGELPNPCWEVWIGERVLSVWPAKDVEEKAKEELIKRDGVMERVKKYLTKDGGEIKPRDGGDWFVLVTEVASARIQRPFSPENLVRYAIELDITPKELMGVEG